MKTAQNAFALALLGVPAFVYGAAVRLRNRLYEIRGVSRRVGIPVISIGNLTVGGTGKTPMVSWLVRHLQERGRRPAVVSRGYKGRAGQGPLLVSTGEGPTVGPEICGDEPYLLARALKGAWVLVGSNRWRCAKKAQELGADCVVLDDGFQHLRLHRDVDLVLLDAHSPFGNYRLLPAGTLREPAKGLARADVILITRSRPDEDFMVLDRVIRRYNLAAPVLRAGHRRAGFVDSRGNPASRPGRAVAFCGIGNPNAFLTDLEAEAIEIAAFTRYRDHHAYTVRDCAALGDLARRHRAILVTTEKDLVRLPTGFLEASADRLAALRIEAVVHNPQRLRQCIDAVLEGSLA
jgi:tetraacyldisaccharide 4'-kinase